MLPEGMPKTLEAEIIEIDGRPPPESEPVRGPGGIGGGTPWILRLDRRWWPLWVLLGGVALIAGVFVGALYLIFVVIRLVFSVLFRGFGKD